MERLTDMIELKQVRVFPLHNPNMAIDNNANELIDMIKGVPIIKDFDLENPQVINIANDTIIGMVSTYGQFVSEGGWIIADIMIIEEYKDWLFKNYQVSCDRLEKGLYKIDRIICVEFGKSKVTE